MDDRRKGFGAFLAELKRRRVYRVGAFYVAAAFLLWQATEIAVPALGLPDVVLTAVVAGSIALLPFALVGAWLFDLRFDDEGSGLPPGVREWLGRSRVRTLLLLSTLIVALVGGAVAVRSVLGPAGSGDAEDGTRIAVFPLATVALDDASYGEGIAELLNVGLDGIPGLDVLDPSAFWPPVLTAGLGPAVREEGSRYLETSRRFDVGKYLTGTVVLAGSALDVSVRIHDGRTGEELGAVRASATVDSLSVLVDELIVGLAAELWDSAQAPEVSSIERFATSVPEALQSYLQAMRHFRRGELVAAEQEIERAVAADSTFALAHLAHFRIRSWRLQMSGDPMTGLREIVERADRHRERLTPRGRMSVAAHLALNRTRGDEAILELERILDIDPDDVAARTLRAFTIGHYGWQFGLDRDDAVRAFDEALALDSASLPLLDLRAVFALRDGDFQTAQALVRRMARIQPTSPLTVGARVSLDLLTAPDASVDSVIQANLDESLTVAIHVTRRVRATSPERALAWSEALMERATGAAHRSLGQSSVFQIRIAAGALDQVEALLGAPTSDYLRQTVLRRLLAADLVGLGSRDLSRQAVVELQAFVPPDSVAEYSETRREAWAAAWAVGAWHAALGDTALATRYREGFEATPSGGIPLEWPSALGVDIQARLAERRGDREEALEHSRDAYALWTIHDPIRGEWDPEPAIRFHRAELLERSGDARAAAALYQSFVHFTWVGFYTPLAALRMGRLLEDAGDVAGARFAYTQAVRLWRLGDEDVVGALLEEAEGRLSGL